jgi:hypothetical protein
VTGVLDEQEPLPAYLCPVADDLDLVAGPECAGVEIEPGERTDRAIVGLTSMSFGEA